MTDPHGEQSSRHPRRKLIKGYDLGASIYTVYLGTVAIVCRITEQVVERQQLTFDPS